MKLDRQKLDREAALQAIRLVTTYALETNAIREPGRLSAVLTDLLPSHPVERDLLKNAIHLNAVVSISESSTRDQLQGAMKALACELVRRHISPEGAAFAAEVISTALRKPEEATAGLREKKIIRRWWPAKRDIGEVSVPSPELKSTLAAADIETKIEKIVESFQYDTFGNLP